MNEDIMKAFGFDNVVEQCHNYICPMCAEVIDIKEFKDILSYNEYIISGLCQECQDKIFGIE